MDRMLVVIFDHEDSALEGSRVLHRLDEDGFLAVYDAAVIAKNHNGTTTVKRGGEFGPRGTLIGLAVGSLIGLVGGPAGVAVGFAGGTLMGAFSDFENVRVGSDFIEDVSKELVPGKVALVAEVEEEEVTPADVAMEGLGGHILRRSLRELKHAENEQDIATIKAEIAHSKAEHAAATAERKAKLQARIDALNERLQLKIDQAKARRESFQHQARAKLEALKTKATKARQEFKAKHEQRLVTQSKEYDQWLERLGS